METQIQNPLRWPDGWTRTNIRDRKANSAWKKSLRDATEVFVKELARMAMGDIAIAEVSISYNSDPSDARRDPGVSVFFSKFRKPDYSWMDSLGLDGVPTVDQIETSFKQKALTCHPDRFPNDPSKAELFVRLTRDRQKGTEWIKGTERRQHDYVIACDRFDEVRLNLMALRGAVSAFRTLERVGVPGMLEHTLQGFKTALPPEGGTSGTTHA